MGLFVLFATPGGGDTCVFGLKVMYIIITLCMYVICTKYLKDQMTKF